MFCYSPEKKIRPMPTGGKVHAGNMKNAKISIGIEQVPPSRVELTKQNRIYTKESF